MQPAETQTSFLLTAGISGNVVGGVNHSRQPETKKTKSVEAPELNQRSWRIFSVFI